MTRLLITSLLLLIGSSCNIEKRCAALFPPGRDTSFQSTDSTWVVKTVRRYDTTIYLPGDSVTIHDSVPCSGDYSAQGRGDYLSTYVHIHDGVLDVNCKTDSLIGIIHHLQDSLIEIHSSSNKQKVITVTRRVEVKVPKPYVPWWVWVFLGLTVVYWAWKLYPSTAGLVARGAGIVSRWF